MRTEFIQAAFDVAVVAYRRTLQVRVILADGSETVGIPEHVGYPHASDVFDDATREQSVHILRLGGRDVALEDIVEIALRSGA
jgi:hypothetical protein